MCLVCRPSFFRTRFIHQFFSPPFEFAKNVKKNKCNFDAALLRRFFLLFVEKAISIHWSVGYSRGLVEAAPTPCCAPSASSRSHQTRFTFPLPTKKEKKKTRNTQTTQQEETTHIAGRLLVRFSFPYTILSDPPYGMLR